MLQDFYFKLMLFVWVFFLLLFFFLSNNPERSITGYKKKYQAKLFPTLIINHHISMISEIEIADHRNKLYFILFT